MRATSAATPPRLITRKEAAAYCGLSVTQFSQWIRDGRISPPIAGTHMFDRHRLDADLDRLSGLEAQSLSPLEMWKRQRNARENRHRS